MEGYLNKWTNAYITFEDEQSVTFNTFKKKLKFTLENLECRLIEDDPLNKSLLQKSQEIFSELSLYDCDL